MVHVDAGGQAAEVDVAVGAGQVGQTYGVTGKLNAAAANRILWGRAVATVRPGQQRPRRFSHRQEHTRKTTVYLPPVAFLQQYI